MKLLLPQLMSPQEIQQRVTFKLQIKKTLDGSIIIRDHPDIDIVIIPKQNKILTFPKEEMNEYVYGSQNIFFHYLVKHGIVKPESVQGGNVYFSIEGKFIEPDSEINMVDVVIYNIGNFLEKEKGYFKAEEEYKDEIDKRLVDPDVEESTELGEVPQGEKKGSIPRNSFPFNFGNSMGVTYESQTSQKASKRLVE